MTPQEALAALARPGWGWTVYSQHYSSSFAESVETKFHVCGHHPISRANVSVIDADLAAAVAEATAKIDAPDPYFDGAAAPERTAA